MKQVNLTLSVITYMYLVHQLKVLHGINSEFSKAFIGQFKGYAKVILNLSGGNYFII